MTILEGPGIQDIKGILSFYWSSLWLSSMAILEGHNIQNINGIFLLVYFMAINVYSFLIL